MRISSFFFPGGFVLYLQFLKPAKNPHRIQVSSADPKNDFDEGAECGKKRPNVSRKKRRKFLGRG
jgi:hypothetical protein